MPPSSRTAAVPSAVPGEASTVHSTAVLIVNSRGQYLLHLRDAHKPICAPGTWSLVGGGSEDGETPHEAIVRELREETGLVLDEVTPFTRAKAHGPYVTEGQIQVFVAHWDGDAHTLPVTEGIMFAWFDVATMAQLTMCDWAYEAILAHRSQASGDERAVPSAGGAAPADGVRSGGGVPSGGGTEPAADGAVPRQPSAPPGTASATPAAATATTAAAATTDGVSRGVKNVLGVHLYLENPAGEILLGRRHPDSPFAGGLWHFLAGHCEQESAVACLVREAEEEAGLLIRPEDVGFAHAVHLIHRPGGQPRLQLVFRARRRQGEPQVQEPDKCLAWRWWPREELPEPIVPYARAAIDGIGVGRLYSEMGW
ncbi:NUDIX hydrolase [Streptomyces sp. 2-6]|uniref:NUDIX hydrolase n=1 Tax=Streptomyces sp. 2-6 TaxID=2978333 RepID=UPI003D1177A1